MDQALSDIRVLDLTQYVAGPCCTKFLADFGDDVVKVERPTGDPARHIGPFLDDSPHPEKSGLFLHLNTNKRSITVNLKTSLGVSVVKELVKGFDVVVESFRPGVMERLGLSYAFLKAINPKLVMTSMSNFGQTGPYRDFKATDLILYAMGTAMNSCGRPGRQPLKLPARVDLFQPGYIGAVATMIAVYGSRYRGIGQHVDVSMMEVNSGSIDRSMTSLLAYQYHGEVSQKVEMGLTGYPAGVYPCKDGYIDIWGGLEWFPKTCAMMGMPELVKDHRFDSRLKLLDPSLRTVFDEIWMPWVLERSKLEIMDICRKYGIMAGYMATMDDLLRDPQYRARGFFVDVDRPVTGSVKQPGAPVKMSITAWAVRRPAPLLGQHNADIYQGVLGFSPAGIAQLRGLGVV